LFSDNGDGNIERLGLSISGLLKDNNLKRSQTLIKFHKAV
jgi:hypothetical protein